MRRVSGDDEAAAGDGEAVVQRGGGQAHRGRGGVLHGQIRDAGFVGRGEREHQQFQDGLRQHDGECESYFRSLS